MSADADMGAYLEYSRPMLPPFSAVEAYTEGWPSFAQGWYGGEFRPRPKPAASESGWRCPGCSRCYAPSQLQCRFCGPRESSAQSRDLTWTPDASEPDEGL